MSRLRAAWSCGSQLLAGVMVLAAMGCEESLEVLTSFGDAGVDGGTCGICDEGRICSAGLCVAIPELNVVTAGEQHTCRVASGVLECWGGNGQAQLGLMDTMGRLRPERIGRQENWLSVSAGARHTCARRAPGAVYCWGDNNQGQLGDGMTGNGRPRGQSAVMGWSDVTAVDCGGENCCAIRSGGALYCWGSNVDSSAGVAREGSAPVTRPTAVAQDWRFKLVSVGGGHSCAIRSDNALVCWGRNDGGQLGDGTRLSRANPVEVAGQEEWQRVATGVMHTCAIRADGTLHCWGSNMDGQLGISDDMLDDAPADTETPTLVNLMRDWSEIAAGDFHTCALKREDNELYCWGRGASGQLGLDDVDNVALPMLVGGAIAWESVALGAAHSCGNDTEQRLHCWGNNANGQLGVGDMLLRARPVIVTP